VIISCTTPMDEPEDPYLLLENFKTHNEYARSTFQMLVSWYSFFISVNLIGGGWFAAQLAKNEPVPILLLLPFTVAFVLFNGIAWGVAGRTGSALRKHHSESRNFLVLMCVDKKAGSPSDYLLTAGSPIPLRFNLWIIKCMQVTFVCSALCWTSATCFSWRRDVTNVKPSPPPPLAQQQHATSTSSGSSPAQTMKNSKPTQ
jgi:hypothetical protein